MKKLFSYFYEGPRPGLKPLTREDYDARLVTIGRGKAILAFDRAWSTRNFEIDLYWKRATYFWAFIASAFVGYFSLVNAAAYRKPDHFQHAEVYFVICLGFLLSLAWLLTNIGSKQWQRHWEMHVDLLEDQFTGPLYKTVHPSVTYSVSKINEIVSVAVLGVWALLAVKFLVDQDLLHFSGRINALVVAASIDTIALSCAMLFGRGRGRFGERNVLMYTRSVQFASTTYRRRRRLGEVRLNARVDDAKHLLVDHRRRLLEKATRHAADSTARQLYEQQVSFIDRVLSKLDT